MNNPDFQHNIIQGGINQHQKLQGDLYDDHLELNKRVITHQKRKMLIVEFLEWSKVVFSYLGILFFVVYAIKVIFYESALDKLILALVDTGENAYKTQIIYAAVIIVYFISKSISLRKK